ncbi:MAG: endonuclease/exonuclease/phosphatase family protein [Candidatus Diapherotrites archaeon]|nr:endonuclease/exonuclease/phosphatase family protein [Candidatus Diapherotrites archaeon]
MALRVMTWNVWSGKNWKQIADFAEKHEVEVMAFQEVDNNLERTGSLNITKEIAGSLGYYSAYSASVENQKTGDFAGGQFGNSILSKFPILENKRYFLNNPEEWDGTAVTQPRTLLETKIKVGGKTVCFMTLHLGYSKEFEVTEIKLQQIEKVVQVLKQNEKFPIVLMGDFNSLPEDKGIDRIRQYLKDVDAKNTLKTWPICDFEYLDWKLPAGLNFKIDYIFVSKQIKHGLPEVDENKISDHVPVIVNLEL